jgi:hypothetical protein
MGEAPEVLSTEKDVPEFDFTYDRLGMGRMVL